MNMIFRLLSLLILAAATPLSAQTATDDKRDDFPQILTVSPKGVNLQTGRFTYSKTDISVGPLSFTRSYGGARVASFDADGNAYANVRNAWAHNYANGTYYSSQGANGGQTNLHFSVPGKTFFFGLGGSSPAPFVLPDNDTIGAKVTRTGDDLTLESREGDKYYFYKHPWIKQRTDFAYPFFQVLRRIEYADGSTIDYVYNSRAQLRQLISNRGYALVLDYDAANRLTTACGYNMAVTPVTATTSCAGAALKASYEYDSNGRPSRVIDASGDAVSYRYSGLNPVLSCVTLANSPTCEISNDKFGLQPGEVVDLNIKIDQVRQQTTANGNVWRYDYNQEIIYITGDAAAPTPREPRYTYASMSGPDGLTSSSITYKNGLVESVQTPEGLYRYEFSGSVPNKIIYPGGNSAVYNRDTYQNLTSLVRMPVEGATLAPITVSQTFPPVSYDSYPPIGCLAASTKLCTKPITRTDERGNQSDFTYAPEHGGILTETGPAVNGVRPQTRYSYAQRYAWIKDASGAFIRATTPIWLLISKSYCKTGPAAGAGCAVAGDEVRTTYDYGPDSGPNNLLLRGTVEDAGGLALRSCYSYDWRGNKISETGPRAELGTCP